MKKRTIEQHFGDIKRRLAFLQNRLIKKLYNKELCSQKQQKMKGLN